MHTGQEQISNTTTMKNYLRLFFVIGIMINASFTYSFTNMLEETRNPRYYENSNKAMINVNKSVFDTLEAERQFERMKPSLIASYQNGVAKQQRCEQLCGMPGKKVKDEECLNIIQDAYHYYSNYIQKTYNGRYTVYYTKNVKKGKLSSEIIVFLNSYNTYLIDSLNNVERRINRGWSAYIGEDKIPYKTVVVSVPNQYYRGRRYVYNDVLDSMDVYQQQKGWEFLNTQRCRLQSESYPEKVEYWVYSDAPEYRVKGNVYDKNGQLVYVPKFTRAGNKKELRDICRLVYYKDYVNNKYNIKSQPKETQVYLKLVLGRDNGFEKTALEVLGNLFASAYIGQMAHGLLSPKEERKVRNEATEYTTNQMLMRSDNIGKNYIEQLEKDHADEFGYVYIIERLSNVSFRIVYLNKETLKPSYCAVVTYKTGEEPYTSAFSSKLVAIPDGIPPVVKGEIK